MYSIITVFGLAGNGFALLVLVKTFRQRSAFHIYMLNLAVSDLLCVSTLPLRVLYYVNKVGLFLLLVFWGVVLCNIVLDELSQR